ncbi:uncharacterized protein [Miscanthus floridulus]|uniref:uncharacterized protein n=1 Tax=Miscanthus floridulus TaxID=154761 RepID=UPI00345A6744
MTDSGKLLLIEEKWATRMKEKKSGKASSSRGGDGQRHGKVSSDKKKKVDPNACRRYGKTGHWADEDDDATLLMVMFCALHDVEAEEKGEVMAVEGHDKALKSVNLDEPCAQVHLGRVDGEQEQRWYLDSVASNHMIGSKEAFSELDDNVTDTLRSSIISIGQLDKRGNEVLIKDDILRIKDREQRLLAKVKRSRNQMYMLDLKVERPICLVAWHTEEPWLWHDWYDHLSFDALSRLEKMV